MRFVDSVIQQRHSNSLHYAEIGGRLAQVLGILKTETRRKSIFYWLFCQSPRFHQHDMAKRVPSLLGMSHFIDIDRA